MLENVAAFASASHAEARRSVLDLLAEDDKYDFHETILCSSSSGALQTRRRWYLVGVLRSKIVGAFSWPEPVGNLPLLTVLGPRLPGDNPSRLPPATQRNARANVSKWRKRIAKDGIDLSQVELVLDCDAFATWCGQPTRIAPCLTRSRAQGLWLLSRGARMGADVCC